MRAVPLLAGAAILAALAGCDPCSGVVSCSTYSHASAEGMIVDASTGRGVDGVAIEAIRQSGLHVAEAVISTVTHDGGHWSADFATEGPGVVNMDVTVTPASGDAYVVRGIALPASERGGEATVLDRWVERPYFPYVGELFDRAAASVPMSNAAVEFRRTSGVELTGAGVADGVFRASADEAGRFAFFPLQGASVEARGVGTVVGTLTVRSRDGIVTSATDVSLPSTYVYHSPVHIFRLPVGFTLDYVLEYHDRARGQIVAGMTGRFERTGGVPASAESFTFVTDRNGRTGIPLQPLSQGSIQGRLVTQPPPPALPETSLVTLATHADINARLLVLGAGAYIPYHGVTRIGDKPAAGISVDVHRSGGIRVSPEDFTVVTAGDSAAFPVNPVPLELGELVVDLTFHPPAPYRAYTVKGLTVRTEQRFVTDRLVGAFDVDRPPAGALLGGLRAGMRAPGAAP